MQTLVHINLESDKKDLLVQGMEWCESVCAFVRVSKGSNGFGEGVE